MGEWERAEARAATDLVPGGDEEVVAVVGEAEVGDPVGGRVGKLPAAADGTWRGGGAHGARWPVAAEEEGLI